VRPTNHRTPQERRPLGEPAGTYSKGEVVKKPTFPIEIIVYVYRNSISGLPAYHVWEGGVASLPLHLAGSEVGIYHLTRTVTFEVEKKFKS
jgi:hypothetical protein